MDDSGKTYVKTYFVPEAFMEREDAESILWDETLREAHDAGVVPVGPIMLTSEPLQGGTAQNGHLIPGVPMVAQHLLAAGMLQTRVVKVTASVMIGASLDL